MVVLFRKGVVLADKPLMKTQKPFTLFYHLPGFYLKTGFLNPNPLSLRFIYLWEKQIYKYIQCSICVLVILFTLSYMKYLSAFCEKRFSFFAKVYLKLVKDLQKPFPSKLILITQSWACTRGLRIRYSIILNSCNNTPPPANLCACPRIITYIHNRPVCCKKFDKTFKLHCLLLFSINNDLISI